ncbi:S-adenosyl-L-methionine-dependent methyltransferase [Echria macrotheca]|uniref:S-adenosyl-L-methionine-dependent methyltransferase n=1 Tax=Echria macrotheca TaxID=438768 RepID=A0AAJ0BA78_9PEZI|nr:S-adenosyl-L-methionine-dependent methyltransferase [Echria macrotheca]
MSSGNERFNEDALAWDTQPSVQRATALAHPAYLSRLPPPATLSTYDVLEIGSGTGLLSLRISPSVRSLTAVDAAEGMIAMLTAKLPTHTPPNILPVCALLEDPDDPRIGTDPVTNNFVRNRRFDLVISHLVLHHIPSPPALFSTLYGCLKSGGTVMVTDYEDFGPEARRFHPESRMDGVERHGVRRADVRAWLEGAGFVDVRVETAFEMEKKVETEPGSGVIEHDMVFPFLICWGTKP